jgi:hypothetical protein
MNKIDKIDKIILCIPIIGLAYMMVLMNDKSGKYYYINFNNIKWLITYQITSFILFFILMSIINK